jgi:PAS domain-containing protein
MQIEALDAAMKLILAGPADQPLMRILRIAADIARCPSATIGVRRDDGFYIIASHGVRLQHYREVLPRSDVIDRHWNRPSIIDDARLAPGFADHPWVTGAPHWRFMAHIPLDMGILPFPVILNVADPRLGVERPAGLLARLEDCAAIASDELHLIGDVALQSAAIRTIESGIELLVDAIRTGPMPLALLDDKLVLNACNRRFVEVADCSVADPAGIRIDTVLNARDDGYEAALRTVLDTGDPLHGLTIRPDDDQRELRIDASRCAASESGTRYLLVTLSDRTISARRGDRALLDPGDAPGVVSRFLRATLVPQKRLLRRGAVPYHALYRWRAAVKDVQIEALKALKQDPGDAFLADVAGDLASAAVALFGRDTFRGVVAVPCGNSGPDCFAARLARLMAKQLDVDLIEPFHPLPRQGGSHPKNNVRRPAMRLHSEITTPVLLIDDVATSGAHIEEAARLLQKSAPAVLPLVWIAD